MKLIFKQRFFSWLDSYDIYDEKGETLFTVEGQLSLGHTLHVHNRHGEHVATLTEELFSLLPSFHVYHQEEHVGSICKEFSFFMPSFTIDYKGWSVQGDFFACDYQVFDEADQQIASVFKEVFEWTDTYVIDVVHPEDALDVLMLMLAIDAEKCSRN